MGFPVAQMVKNLPAIHVPGLGRSPGKGNGNPLLPREFHGQRSLAGYSPWDCKELDTTERLTLSFHTFRLLIGVCVQLEVKG